MKTILILILSMILISSCDKLEKPKALKHTATSSTVAESIQLRMISDARNMDEITWSYHPYIKKCYYNEEKEIYLYDRDSFVMIVDYKNNVIHDFSKEESKEIMYTIEEFEILMHDIDLGKVHLNVVK
jgi:hypothetical protein